MGNNQRLRLPVALTAVLLAVVSLGLYVASRTPDLPRQTKPTPVPTTPVVGAVSAGMTPTVPASPILSAGINRVLSNERGVYGVVVMRRDGTIAYARNPDTPFIAASLYKLILLATIYAKRDHGEVASDQELELLPDYFPRPGELPDSYFDKSAVGTTITVDKALFATGAYSSNITAKALLTLTDWTQLEATARELGLMSTHFFVKPAALPSWPPRPSANTSKAETDEAVAFINAQATAGPVILTTPRDMASFFAKLLAGQVVSAGASRDMLDILQQQVVDDRFPVLLPEGTLVAHKTGNLDHVVHDVGVIFTAHEPVILAAMVEDPPDDRRATELIQRLAFITYSNHGSTLSRPHT